MIPEQAHSDGMCKKVGARSRRRPWHDREFLKEFKALTATARHASSTPGRDPIVIGNRGSLSLPLPSTGPLSNLRTCKPSPWREADEATHAHFALEAIKAQGAATAATAHLSEAVNAAAYTDPAGPLIFLRRRIAAALKAALGRPILFVWSLEESEYGRGRPRKAHLHGVLGINPAKARQLAKARAALRRACGEWIGSARCRQVRFSANPDAGWASYFAKDCKMATPRMVAFLKRIGAGPRWLPGHAGPTLTMDNETRANAKQLHEEARRIVWEARQRPKAIESPETAAKPATAASANPRPLCDSFCRARPAAPVAPRSLPAGRAYRRLKMQSNENRPRGPPYATACPSMRRYSESRQAPRSRAPPLTMRTIYQGCDMADLALGA